MIMRVSSFEFRVSSGVCRRVAASPRRTPHSSFIIHHSSFPRGFSLVEVLLAIFILGIGMIMVASIFPVGANWTRQTTEGSVGQNVAQNAFTVLQNHYGPNGNLHYWMAPDFLAPGPVPNTNNHNSILQSASPFSLQALPGFTSIPPTERAYQFGGANPFPASNVTACTYSWTALARLSPSYYNANNTNPILHYIQPSSSYKYDVYILVFRKGAAEQVFAPVGGADLALRDFDGNGTVAYPETLFPSLVALSWNQGSYDPSRTPSVYGAIPPLGQFGIGVNSGTVFHQILNSSNNYQSAIPSPPIIGNEPIICAPPADGTSEFSSPLIYIYQTTMSF